MGTTSTYLLPYPELDDPDDVPTDMRELAEAVEDAIDTLVIPQPGYPQEHVVIPAFAAANTHVNWPAGWENERDCPYHGVSLSSGAQNAQRNYQLQLAAGTWTVELLVMRQVNAGIYTIQLDGVTVGSVDGYSPTQTAGVFLNVTGMVVAVDGRHTLTLKMATKNASSSAYYAYLGHLALYRTG